MQSIVQLTDSAYEHIAKMVADHNALGFRLSLKNTGCSGYAYVPEIINEITHADDIHFKKNDLAIYIALKDKEFLTDVIIDFVADNKSGIKQKKLVFINPHEKNRCGCGESFTTE